MKKILALVLASLMLVLNISAGAAGVPDALKNPMLNYTGTSSVSMSFDNAEQFAAALEEMTGFDASEGLAVVDIAALLKSLYSFSGSAIVKADISEDYNKIALSMEADFDYNVDVNQHLGVSADIKAGVWLNMDLSDVTDPKCFVVLSSPVSTKYTYADLFSTLDDQSKLMVVAVMKMFLNKNFIDSVNAEMVKFYEENAEITYNGKNCTMRLDNEDYLGLMDVMTDLMAKTMRSLIPTGGEYNPEEHEIVRYADSGIKMLGDGGYVIEYNEDGTVKEYCDIEMDLGDLFKYISGEEMPFENVVLKLSVEGNGKLFDVGTTEVTLPELTEENSLDLIEYFKAEQHYEEDNYEENYIEEYPFFYASAYADYVPVIDGEYYVPFRALLEDAYGGNVDISYENGVVSVTSEYFTDLEKLTFTVGSSKANVDGHDFEVGQIVLENGVTYVSPDFFEVIFDWSFDWASYDILNVEYNFGFYTYDIYGEYYDEI